MKKSKKPLTYKEYKSYIFGLLGKMVEKRLIKVTFEITKEGE